MRLLRVLALISLLVLFACSAISEYVAYLLGVSMLRGIVLLGRAAVVTAAAAAVIVLV